MTYTSFGVEWTIAARYLVSKKKQNSINIISAICAGGICVASIALVCILSVYNGFQGLVRDLYSAFDPHIRIESPTAKVFSPKDETLQAIRAIEGVLSAEPTLEDEAIIRCGDKQTNIRISGITETTQRTIGTEQVTYAGEFAIGSSDAPFAVAGAAIAAKVDADVYFQKPISIYAPIHDAKINASNPSGAFNEMAMFVSGLYAVHQQETDAKFVFIPLQTARDLFGRDSAECSHIDVTLSQNANEASVKEQIEKIINDEQSISLIAKDRDEMHEDYYKMLKVEKWITFLILVFVLLVAVVNVISSLSMLIIEKEWDIETLRCLGADSGLIRRIFLIEGWSVTAIGGALGVAIGTILCVLQAEFGFIKLGSGGMFVVDAYPVVVEATDLFLVLATIMCVGLGVAYVPTRYVGKRNCDGK